MVHCLSLSLSLSASYKHEYFYRSSVKNKNINNKYEQIQLNILFLEKKQQERFSKNIFNRQIFAFWLFRFSKIGNTNLVQQREKRFLNDFYVQFFLKLILIWINTSWFEESLFVFEEQIPNGSFSWETKKY